MLWLNFIHLYQPANIEKAKLIEATEKSYERLLRALEEHPQLKMTANIAGSLLDRWTDDLDRADLIARFKKIIQRGQLEVVGSAAYHALLPLVSKKEVIAQITEQERLLEVCFGIKKPKGFFLPEMAYSPEVAKIIKKLGYEWLIVDELTVFGHVGEASGGVYWDKNSGLKIIARDRIVSESYVPDQLREMIASGVNKTVVTGTDAELYGLRHLDQSAEFEKIVKISHLKTETLSKYIAPRKGLKKIQLIPSNWQTTESDLLKNMPYSLWQNDRNIIQADLWRLADLAQELFYKNQKDKNIWWSRWHLWRGLASCSWWWSSKNDFRMVFGPLAWNPDEVEKGTLELIRSIRSLEASTDKATKLQAEKLAQKIRTNVWLKHWQ